MDALLKAVVKKVLKVIVKTTDDRLAETVARFIKFGIVGVTDTVISYLINLMVSVPVMVFCYKQR